ncbi:tyrosine-type recombinase/integrase [Sphingomonas sp. H39-1-10]|uniref:tyrosine-type recombinase/integrase n=1 Tax=Sphingomonas pollutisoli TaxID=3030829 RepID=UPI0023B8E322|nr:tyrosine-type recombinase/integrase [Sphingomonas pollutisoli]MDF0488826.1 tyrosine-type recombinase/integrase [Sphingomonas pollutisoli]
MAKVLTVTGVEKVSKAAARQEIPDALVPGLYLVVQPSGKKSWAVRYRLAGKPQKFTVGSYPALDLPAAREEARSVLRAAAEGRDPCNEKRISKAAEKAPPEAIDRFMVEKVVATYITRYAKKRTRERSWQETERLLNVEMVPDPATSKRNAPTLRGRDIREVTRSDLKAILDAVVDRGAEITANRVLAAMRHFFGWAVEREIITVSPCEGIKPPAEERSRDRVLTDVELAQIWREVEGLGDPFGPLIKLLALTGQRRSEVSGMTWGEIDLDEALWTIPAARAKNGRAHAVPLSPQAVAILKALPRVRSKAGYVFTTTGETSVSGLSKAKQRIDAALLKAAQKAATEAGEDPESVQPIERWTLHDLRRTAATGMARLKHPVAVVEKVLNHISGSFRGIVGVYQLYDFADEKRAALADWASHVERVTSPSETTTSTNVIPFAAVA